ncbi:polysaccharide biosynthesis C-terminal domain-containing protein [Natronococcus sp. A-GB1]|uniref:oligosaccharide flippase family protein n=1 Tax=Natronococcus sp. A-GB1 TaxID=3037648 RepID=UPI0024202397|nr:polysaccharide biosynthesis C-terminal domain-containing protein [Natronococcus sp. A-GB1]MDG5761741.1 polysaccharide biosynthesis C-terminal domain-containing protein [Natronococcus sp. A-GB1]
MDLLRSGAKLLSARTLSSILTFLGLAYFARTVGATELGVFFMFQALLSFLVIPSNLGLRLALEKRISESSDNKSAYLTTGLLMKVALLAGVALLVLALDTYITQYLGADLTLYLIIALVCRELGELMVGVIRGELRVGETAILQLAYSTGWIGTGVVLTTIGYGLYGLVYALIVGYLAKLLWAIHRQRTPFGKPNLALGWSLAGYGVYSIIPSIDGEVHNWMDIFLISLFMTPAAVAAYEFAWRISEVFKVLISAISETIFPQISAWDAEGSVQQLEEMIPRAITPGLILVIPATAGAWLLGEELLEIVFGAEYAVAGGALVILLAGKAPRMIRAVVGKCLLGIDRADRVTIAAVVDIVANVVLNIILIQLFGLAGAALGTTLSLLIGLGVRWWFLSQELTVSVEWRSAVWSLGASGVMFVVLWAVLSFVEISGLVSLLLAVASGAMIYFATLSLNDRLRTDARSLFQAFL